MPRQTIIQKGTGEDLFVYFHIEGSYIREQAKSATTDCVVSELWGAGSSAYRSVIAGYGGWEKYVADVARTCGKPGFKRTCVTTWSAGSEVLRTICRGVKMPDAIVSLDGIYGSKPPGAKPGDGNIIFDPGLEAIAQYALAAARGERIFVLFHSSIATPYGSSVETAARIRRYVEDKLGAEMRPDTSLNGVSWAGPDITDNLVLGDFHMCEFEGRDAKEHVREAHLFDEVWRRWIPWAANDAPAAAPAPAVDLPPGSAGQLAVGAKGPPVGAWQTFLVGHGATIVVDDDFGKKTEAATKAFQGSVRIEQTGRVDTATMESARALGFGAPVGGPLHPVETKGPEWPPAPSFPPLVGNQARAAEFGSFLFEAAPTPGNPEGIRILGTWAGANIVQVHIPQLRGIVGAPESCRVPFHRLAAERVRELFDRWEKAHLLPLIKTWAGSWAPRYIRGSRSVLSNHAYGTAFDINAAWNGLGAVPALAGRTGSVRELVPIANELGFFWGGHFSTRKDGMHFELAKRI